MDRAPSGAEESDGAVSLASRGAAADASAFLRACVWIAVLLATIAWIWIVHTRLSLLSELHWLGGLVREGIERVAAGLPLYPPPADGFIPPTSPPLYFGLSALLVKLGASGYTAARIVSVAASLGLVLLIGRTVLRATGSRLLCGSGIAFFLAGYGLCGSAHDLETAEALSTLLAIAGAIALLEGRSPLSRAGAGALVAAAGLTELSAFVFLIAGAIGLYVIRDRRGALAFLLCATVLSLLALVVLHVTSAGWSTYYLLWLPLQHNFEASRVLLFLGWDLPRLVILAIFVFVGGRFVSEGEGDRARRVLCVCIASAGLLAAMLGRLSLNGTGADLLPMLAALTLTGTLAAGDIARGISVPRSRAAIAPSLLHGLLLAQLTLLYYDPTAFAPDGPLPVARQSFDRVVAELEAKGETWVVSHGALARHAHPHLLPLSNLLRAEKQLPVAVDDAIRNRRYRYIVSDRFWDTPEELRKLLQRYYYVSERVALTPWTRVEFQTVPEWILEPRPKPLWLYAPVAVLNEQTHSEMVLADLLQRMRGENSPNLAANSRLDQLAERLRRAIETSDEPLRDALCSASTDGELCRALWRHTRRDRGQSPPREMKDLGETLGALLEERATFALERKALLDEIACLRTLSAADRNGAHRCFEISVSPAELPMSPAQRGAR